MKYSLVVYSCISYTWYNFQNILICFELFRDILDNFLPHVIRNFGATTTSTER